MIWLVWRRQRVALLVAVGVAVALAVVLAIGRWRTLATADELGLAACLPAAARVCTDPPWDEFRAGFSRFYNLVRVALVAAPAVLGIIAGAGLFSRELERGTHMFALTQSTGRLRWWGLGLLVSGIPVAVAAALLTMVAGWAFAPFPSLTGLAGALVRTPNFEFTGLVPFGYTVLAFSLAAVAGLVLRSALGAVALAFALQLAVQLLLSFVVREQYLPAVTAIVPVDESNYFASAPVGALQLDYGYLDAGGRQIQPGEVGGGGACATVDYSECLRASGINRAYVVFQPRSRYWPFQGIESGILLVLVAGTLGVGLWGLRKRVG